ncbi:Lamin tail domain-containing protein 2 [Microtus ochrogaster]|uniref:Lamin tail domain-containing protein 2 n=1 Tax=Microtus ochrogaster TaxID=79684 RepID=A0A8J6GE44_MICOH|nr:Lamin tail domain-containing protein 2 [Microtus ochrogaster]
MAPKSCQESEDEQVSPAPAGVKPDSSDLESAAGTPMDTEAPSCSRSTRPDQTTRGWNCRLVPETMDPRTLRLLWEQRELEIQALRWAVQNGQNARYYHILQEVAGIPPERNSKSQDRFLQNQVQKLTLELKTQKEQAQLEKERLEEKLRQNHRTMQQMEAELQTFQKSCLLQLARSSWVGRVIRSQTGSVEVVTAEVLRDPTDSTEYVEGPTSREIAAVSHREKFIRILNQSQAETVDLGGFVVQQLVRDYPVCMYRFPPGILLAPQHHITVWGEGTSRTKKQLPVSSGQEPFHFQSSLGCVTVLVNPHGQVLSEHQAAPSMTLGSKMFTDNTDWSIDRFPLSESEPKADSGEEQCRPSSPHKGRVRDSGARRKKPGPGVHQQRHFRTGTSGLRTSGSLRPTETRDILPLLSTRKLLHPGEVPAQQEGVKAETAEPLPAIPECSSRVCLEDSLCQQERKVQVCRKSVDLSCPMVALSVQSTAESRYGFRFLCYPPITEDLCRRL